MAAHLERAQDLIQQYARTSRTVLIGDPSDAQRPFAISFDTLLAQALLTTLQTPAPSASTQRGAVGEAVSKVTSATSALPPPTPLTVIAAAEKWLARLAGSGKLLHVVVDEAQSALWPTAALQLQRRSLIVHLTCCAADASNRLHVVHVRATVPDPRAPASTGSVHHDGSANLRSLQEYLEGVFPAALIVADASTASASLAAVCPLSTSTRPKLDHVAEQKCKVELLQPLALSLADAALTAGIVGVGVVAPDDVFSSGSGTFAPMTKYSESAAERAAIHAHLSESRDANPDRVRGISAPANSTGSDPTAASLRADVRARMQAALVSGGRWVDIWTNHVRYLPSLRDLVCCSLAAHNTPHPGAYN